MGRGRRWSTWRPLRLGRRGGRTGGRERAALLLTAAVGLLGVLLLRAIWVVFQHAYLNSYLYVPGSRVTSAYWGAIAFALRATVLVVALVAAAVALLAVILGRGRRR